MHETHADLLERVKRDIAQVVVRRGVNALTAMVIAIAEISATATALVYTGMGEYQRAAVFTIFGGLAVTVDNAMRVRENTSSQQQRYNALRAIEAQIEYPMRERSPLWEEYHVAKMGEEVDYIAAVLALCTARFV
jgi:hypothetical protein